MAVSAVQSVAPTSAGSLSGSSSEVVSKDDFLFLLVTQLKNQDPLNPMSGTEFTTQLAQFSSLEQLQNINDNLSGLTGLQTAMQSGQALDYIGKTVVASGNTFQLRQGVPATLAFDLPADAAGVYVNVYDATGALVRSVDMGATAAGSHLFSWDGRDQNGVALPDGSYTAEIQAVAGDGSMLQVTTSVSGLVSSVAFREGRPVLIVGDREVAVSDVIRVQQPAEQTGQAPL